MIDLGINWGEMLRQFRLRASLNKSALAREVGVSIGYITKLEGGIKKPPPEQLRDHLADVLGLDDEDRKWFHIKAELERINPESVKYIKMLVEDMPEELGKRDSAYEGSYVDTAGIKTELFKIPIINKAAAGRAIDFTDLGYPVGIADTYIAVPDIDDPNAFAFYVSGDSMEPDFPDGTLLIASPRTPVYDGDPCFVRFSTLSEQEGCTFKKVYFLKDGRVRLVSINQKYPEQIVEPQYVLAVWPVVRAYKKLGPRLASLERRGERRAKKRGQGTGGLPNQALTAG